MGQTQSKVLWDRLKARYCGTDSNHGIVGHAQSKVLWDRLKARYCGIGSKQGIVG